MRTRVTRSRGFVLLLGALLLLGACGSAADASPTTPAEATTSPGATDATPPGPSDETLRLAFFADMQTADPDVFFDIEGLAVMLSVYEGLLEYAPDSTELVGNLAESWDVSADQKTYTFKLREGLTFADGSPLDSTAMKASFERRSSVNQAPGYMVAGVESYETPDPLTLVVNLAAPDVSFLHLMASAWSPKATNPAVLEKEGPDDFAQAFLESNSAGSGPYVLERFDRGVGYALVRNENYWGEPPYFARVEISVSPDISTQLLALERGDLDAILHGFPLANLENARGNSDLKIHLFESLGTTTLFLNTFRPALADTDAREAMMLAIDIPELVQEVYGDTAQTPDNAYPPGLLDPALAPVNYEGDPDVSAIEPGTEISIVYTPDSSGVQRRLADLMRLRLAEVGVVANPRQVQLSEVFGYRENVADAAEIYISTPTPDGAHPDTWARLCWYTEGPLNFFNYSNADLDAAVNRGISETNEEASMQAYGEAGRLATADWAVVPFAYVNDVVVARGDLGNLNHIPAYPWTIDLGSLTRGG